MSARKKPALSAYWAKRRLGATPEPLSSRTAKRQTGWDLPRFVVHAHAARNMHYDLRLEISGVFESWAVPRGPSLNPQEKRLAVHVEPHPMDYGDFEGVIPDGNYGAGNVVLWDAGLLIEKEPFVQGLRDGKLLFELRGFKLRGLFTLVRTKEAGGKHWLLIKKVDGFSGEHVLGDESVFSGLTCELRSQSVSLQQKVARLAAKVGGKPSAIPRELSPMLCESVKEPFDRAGWRFEIKYDGYRVLAYKTAEGIHLWSRGKNDVADEAPQVTQALKLLPYETLILDGELIRLDATGRSDRLLLRGRRSTTEMASPCIQLVIFDVLYAEGYDLRASPLTDRRLLLDMIVPPRGVLLPAFGIAKEGKRLFAEAARLGLEGIIAKNLKAPYVSRRTDQCVKVRVGYRICAAVIGFSKPQNSRHGFASLYLAALREGRWTPIGLVGAAFRQQDLRDVFSRLQKVPRSKPLGPPVKDVTWVEPQLIVEVAYQDFHRDGLREARFVKISDTQDVNSCTNWPMSVTSDTEGENFISDGEKSLDEPEEKEAQAILAESTEPRLTALSNPQKVFWPGENITKKDLSRYYEAISPWLLPYLKNRALVLTRYPDGIEGKSFYQKDAPGWIPAEMRTTAIWSEHTQRDLHYFLADGWPQLAYLVNLGTIPLHIWLSRMSSLETPDFCLIDLDPKDADFAHVITIAQFVGETCKKVDLPCYVKTTGSSGLHLAVPLGGRCTYEQCRSLANILCTLVTKNLPEIATLERNIASRKRKVYLDWLQNRHGQLMVAPYSVRPLPHAPVSMPIAWSEVNSKLTPRGFTIKNAIARVNSWNHDPFLPVLHERANLVAALEKLTKMFT